ncbi:uncharacterized protein LOC127866514 isoform X2 [Dreissena polymorpha]|uniref:uncharacterized protein LOC127866514 isoform X2 n=1 Tax=Dreissena polymorpha TaxID=45954 RepID=UPI0022650FAD|nr:uncharacterized protein LOC127866514 isoform X2 [Dreissena polymorpha]
MDENEKDKASQRANLIEQRMFEITLSSIKTLKHATAIELHKSQNEMKKRLRKYRDRQREIVRNKRDSHEDPIEEIMARQIKSKAKARRRKKTRPKTCPPALRNADNSPRSKNVSPRSPMGRDRVSSRKSIGLPIRLFGDSSSESEDEDSDANVEIDGSVMIDQQKSKIDLRPKTALDIVRRGVSLQQLANNGRLGPAVRQIRYFDEDELKDRGHFYEHLVQKRIQTEKNKLQNLNGAVAKFCESETIQTMTSNMKANRAFFIRNSNWNDSVNNKLRSQKGVSDPTRGCQMEVKPSTAAGLRNPSRAVLSTFRIPSYIAT